MRTDLTAAEQESLQAEVALLRIRMAEAERLLWEWRQSLTQGPVLFTGTELLEINADDLQKALQAVEAVDRSLPWERDGDR